MPMGTALFYASRTTESTRPRRSCEGSWTYVFLLDAPSGGTVYERLERRSPGCSIVFYIDAEQANVCNLHVAQGPLIKRRSTASGDTDVTGDSKKSRSRSWAASKSQLPQSSLPKRELNMLKRMIYHAVV